MPGRREAREKLEGRPGVPGNPRSLMGGSPLALLPGPSGLPSGPSLVSLELHQTSLRRALSEVCSVARPPEVVSTQQGRLTTVTADNMKQKLMQLQERNIQGCPVDDAEIKTDKVAGSQRA